MGALFGMLYGGGATPDAPHGMPRPSVDASASLPNVTQRSHLSSGVREADLVTSSATPALPAINAKQSGVNVGVYIDPESVGASFVQPVNVGDYIDPEDLPIYPSRPFNVGSYIDPEDMPSAVGVRVNHGVYKDPEALTSEIGFKGNSGPPIQDPNA